MRSGAFVVVTTRFPVDAVQRYSQEVDFCNWYKRLRVFQIDFRQLQNLFELVKYVENELKYLDILINNAAQTVRHSFSYYQELFTAEYDNFKTLPEELKSLIVWSRETKNFESLQQSLDMLLPIAPLKLKEGHDIHKLEKYSCKELTQDYINKIQSYKNSWTSKACDISLVEMLEVQLINVTAPFVLCTSLRHLMQASPHTYKYIVNVSAIEGKFNKTKNVDGVVINDKCKSLAMKIKEIIDTKSSFADWLNNQIIRDQLKFDIKVCLIKNGYPPQYSPRSSARLWNRSRILRKIIDKDVTIRVALIYLQLPPSRSM